MRSDNNPPCLDDLLLQEIYSLREKIKIAIEIIHYYNSDFNKTELLHALGHIDFDTYIEEVVNADRNLQHPSS